MQSGHVEAQSFAYERKGNSAVIRRCFSRAAKAVIPDQIEGLSVTEIAPYAFSAYMDEAGLLRDFRLRKLKISASMLLEEAEAAHASDESGVTAGSELAEIAAELPVLCGERLEKLALPASVSRVGRYCFYNCDRLKALAFTGNLTDWGSGVFTGCHHISEIRVAVSEDGTSMLKDMLDEVNEELCVTYEGKETAKLMFPEFYEEGVENTPARILETRVHGSGMRYRNCFQNRRIDIRQYDKLFAHAVFQESREFIVKLVLGRLQYPYELAETARKQYETYVREHPCEFAQYLVKKRDIDKIRWICELLEESQRAQKKVTGFGTGTAGPEKTAAAGFGNDIAGSEETAAAGFENDVAGPEGSAAAAFADAVLEEAGRKQFAEAMSYVMEYRHAHTVQQPKKRRRLEL